MSKKIKLLFVLVLVFFLTGCIFNREKDEKDVVTYKISFDTDGGTNISSQMIEKGKYITKPNDPVKSGYHFIEWTYSNQSYDFSMPVNSDMTLKAKYIKIGEETEEFIVKFNTDGGVAIPNQIVKKGEKIKQPDNPTKDNYGFIEWQLDGKTYDFNSEVKENITLKAVWKKYEDYGETFFAMSCGSVEQKYLNKGDIVNCHVEFEVGGYSSKFDAIKSFKLDVNYGKGLKLLSFSDTENNVVKNGNTYNFNLDSATSVGFVGLWKFEVVDASNDSELYVSLENQKFQTTNNGFYYCDNSKEQLKSVWDAPDSEYKYYGETFFAMSCGSVEQKYLNKGDIVNCHVEFEVGGYSSNFDAIKSFKLDVNYGKGLKLLSFSDTENNVVKNGNTYNFNLDSATSVGFVGLWKFEVVDVSNDSELYVSLENGRFHTNNNGLYYCDNSREQLSSMN